MTADNPISDETAVPVLGPATGTILSAHLTPHRSLSPRGFTVLMGLFGAVSFVSGIMFLRIGAWPVFGFFGLDVLILWWALKASYKSGRMAEEVTVTSDAVVIRRISVNGAVTDIRLNPLWLQVDTITDPDDGMMHLAVRSHGKSHVIGDFLDPASRESFAAALNAAVLAAKRGTVLKAEGTSV